MSVSWEQQLLVYTTAVMLVSLNPTYVCYDESKMELNAQDIALLIRSKTEHLCERNRLPPVDSHVSKVDIEKIFKSKIMRNYLTEKRFFSFTSKSRKSGDGGVVYSKLRYPSLALGCYYVDKIDTEERLAEYIQLVNKVAKTLLFDIFEDTFGTLSLRFSNNLGAVRQQLKQIRETKKKAKNDARNKRIKEEQEREEEKRMQELKYTYSPMIAASTCF